MRCRPFMKEKNLKNLDLKEPCVYFRIQPAQREKASRGRLHKRENRDVSALLSLSPRMSTCSFIASLQLVKHRYMYECIGT